MPQPLNRAVALATQSQASALGLKGVISRSPTGRVARCCHSTYIPHSTSASIDYKISRLGLKSTSPCHQEDVHMKERTNPVVRVQLDLPADQVRELEELMERAKISTKKDLINNALTLLEWAINEKSEGRTIASINEKNMSYKELVMPVLSAVAPKAQSESDLVLSGATA